MSEHAERVTKADEAQIRFSPALVERAQRMVGAPHKASRMQLPLFSAIAGLMAGSVIKRQRPPSK